MHRSRLLRRRTFDARTIAWAVRQAALAAAAAGLLAWSATAHPVKAGSVCPPPQDPRARAARDRQLAAQRPADADLGRVASRILALRTGEPGASRAGP